MYRVREMDPGMWIPLPIPRLQTVTNGLLAVAILVSPALCRVGECCAVSSASAVATNQQDDQTPVCPHCRPGCTVPVVPRDPDEQDRCSCSEATVACVTVPAWRLTHWRLPVAVAGDALIRPWRAEVNPGKPRPVWGMSGRLLCYSNGVLRC